MEKLKRGEIAQKEESVSSKGFYRYPQPSDYVCLKQYIFLRRGSEKHLLLRFENDTQRKIDFIEIAITELNIDGKVIKTDRIRSAKVAAFPGGMFSLPQKLTVSKECVDFKVKVLRAVSGSYVYTVKNGAVQCRYDKGESVVRRAGFGSRGYRKKQVRLSRSSSLGVVLPIFVLLIVGIGAAYSALTLYTDFRLKQIPEFVFDFLSDVFDWIFRSR